MRHGVPEIEVNDDLNILAMAHRRQTNIPANIDYHHFKCLGGKLLIKLGGSALYVLFWSYRKKERIQLLAPCYFQTQQVLSPVCFHAESTAVFDP